MATRTKKAANPLAGFQTVERPASKRGRKAHAKPGMDTLVENWSSFPVGSTIVLPDYEGTASHEDVSRNRYHFDKRARVAGLKASVDYAIDSHPDHGAVITRLV